MLNPFLKTFMHMNFNIIIPMKFNIYGPSDCVAWLGVWPDLAGFQSLLNYLNNSCYLIIHVNS